MNRGDVASAERTSRPIDTHGEFELATWQVFIRGVRNFWRTEAYSEVISSVEDALSPEELEDRYSNLAAYRLYSWLERYSQQMKYYGRRGLADLAAQRKDACRRLLNEARARHAAGIELNDEFEVPSYVRDSHTHQHNEGVWQHPESAFVYEASTSGFSFALGDSTSPMRVYADAAKALADSSGHAIARVIDAGCAIGGSTRALKSVFPDADVLGVDVCAPALMLAHLRSQERGEQIRFALRAAENLREPDESIDLVASHWLYHEMPVNAIRAALKEAYRVLAKGGLFLAFDMYLVPGGSTGAWLNWGYARRNNEPFSFGFTRMDMKNELERVGFTDVEIKLAFPEPVVKETDVPDSRTHYLSLITCRKPI